MMGALDQVVAGDVPAPGSFRPKELNLVDHFTTFFGEWELKGNDILIHLFPRDGEQDQRHLGHYIPKCRKCARDRSGEDLVRPGSMKPCACGHAGLVYIPGRREMKAEVEFPQGMMDIIKSTVDLVWEGGVAIEEIEELGAYVVQIQDGASVGAEAINVILSGFFSSMDEQLDR